MADFDDGNDFVFEPIPPEECADELNTSWNTYDPAGYLTGEVKPEIPTMLARTDGVCLIYPGKTHSLYGESESCKSWVMQHETACRLKAGDDVLYLDFEDTIHSLIGRLRALGTPDDAIRRHLFYANPETNPYRKVEDLEAFELLLSRRYTLCVIDGVTQALARFGYKTESNDDVTDWTNKLPDRIARVTGAGVVMIDHVVKASDSRGRYALGAGSKLTTLTGAAYLVEMKEMFGRGRVGKVTLRSTKDRPGSVRGMLEGSGSSDHREDVAVLKLDATDPNSIKVTVWPPYPDKGGPFRPAELMEDVSKVLEVSTKPMSRNDIWARVGGNKQACLGAIVALISEGFVEPIKDTERAPLRSLQPFRKPEPGFGGIA